MTDLPVITDDVLDQWEQSALADQTTGETWSVNPLAILAVVTELRAHRAVPWEYGLQHDNGIVETVIGGTAIRDEADARSVIAAEQVRKDGLPPVALTVVRRRLGEWEAVDA